MSQKVIFIVVWNDSSILMVCLTTVWRSIGVDRYVSTDIRRSLSGDGVDNCESSQFI